MLREHFKKTLTFRKNSVEDIGNTTTSIDDQIDCNIENHTEHSNENVQEYINTENGNEDVEQSVDNKSIYIEEMEKKPKVPKGMFRKCEACRKAIYEEDIKANKYCCPVCGKHFRIDPWTRLSMVVDKESFVEWDCDVCGENPLNFPDYEEKREALREKTGLSDAVLTGRATIRGLKTAIGVMSPDFLMGSMGTAVGERITKMVERATEEKLPVILFCCSGGARMQEGIFSLMQMAKTSQALKKHDEAGLLYISVLTDPTTGGVTASFAMLGDIILAEPGALIGFAGARVIKQTIGQKLPEGFQSAEFLLKHGFIDRIVKREHMRKTLAVLLHSAMRVEDVKVAMIEEEITEPTEDEVIVNSKIETKDMKDNMEETEEESEEVEKTAWDRVLAARDKNRAGMTDYISEMCNGFMEFHGDRLYGDDRAVIGGIGAIGKQYVTIIGQQKGRNVKENKFRNFGMMNPEGYRKSLRLMKQAEKFHRPIILFVDTPGAFCGVEAEERGQGEAIARNLFEMSSIKVPILTIILGEGGSGGALALAMGNEVWMMENAVYSILSPEGFASILWKDGKRAAEAADVMKMTASDLQQFGMIEKVIPEKRQADRAHIEEISIYMRENILEFLRNYSDKSEEEIVEQRYKRFRSL